MVVVSEFSNAEGIASFLMTGISIHFLYGPAASVAALVASIVLPWLSKCEPKPSVRLNKELISDLKEPWKKTGLSVLKSQILIGSLLKLSGGAIHQVAIRWIRQNMSTPLKTFCCYMKVAVIVPVIEEFAFRGFLQDRIRDIQALAFGGEKALSSIQTIFRVVLQAVFFGLAHYHPCQGAFNLIIVVSTGLLGLYFGLLKEDTGGITQSISTHSLVNTSVTTRVWLFGA